MNASQLNFTAVESPEAFYVQLQSQVPLPKTFGRNLDALFDFLTTDLPGPVKLSWRSYAKDVLAHPELRTVRAVLLSALSEREDITIDWG